MINFEGVYISIKKKLQFKKIILETLNNFLNKFRFQSSRQNPTQ